MASTWNVNEHDTMLEMNGFGVNDFMDDPNFDHFINLIRGESQGPPPSTFDPIHDLFFNCQFLPCPCVADPSFRCSDTCLAVHDHIPRSPLLSSLSCFDGDVQAKAERSEGHPEDDGDGEDSSAIGSYNNNSKQTPKADRSTILISERRRRGRMKQALYALRSLVPNISKMDKASIVGDAATYVRELQAQAEKLKADIEDLEVSSSSRDLNNQIQGSDESPTGIPYLSFCKKIMQMEVVQVEGGEFNVKVVAKKGEGVASSLYRALESLSGYSVGSSQLATLCDSFQLMLTLKQGEQVCEAETNLLLNLKLWITGALLSQGFEFM